MAYELRIGGTARTQFETEQEAVAAAGAALDDDPNAVVEIIDTRTGQPSAPGADQAWREELRNRVGF